MYLQRLKMRTASVTSRHATMLERNGGDGGCVYGMGQVGECRWCSEDRTLSGRGGSTVQSQGWAGRATLCACMQELVKSGARRSEANCALCCVSSAAAPRAKQSSEWVVRARLCGGQDTIRRRWEHPRRASRAILPLLTRSHRVQNVDNHRPPRSADRPSSSRFSGSCLPVFRAASCITTGSNLPITIPFSVSATRTATRSARWPGARESRGTCRSLNSV